MVDVPDHLYVTDHCIVTHNTIGSEQRLQQGITNLSLDNAALNLNGVYTRVRGKNVPTQQIRIAPGKIVDVEEKDGFQVLKRLDPIPEALQHLNLSQARAEQVSGANEPATQGVAGPTGHSNLARSAAGANLIASGASTPVSDFIEKLSSQVIVPFLTAAHELNRALLPQKTVRYILSDELEHEYMNDVLDDDGKLVRKGGDMIELLNARVRFSILAGAKMQARRSMAQSLPIFVQFLTSPEFSEQLAIQGLKVDIKEIIRMFYVVSDWKNESAAIVPMTDEDKQRMQQRQNGALQGKIQGQAMLEQQKFQNRQKELDSENVARAARDVLREIFKNAAQVPGGTGAEAFGGTV
jgi:hypothetical protein